jgi:hypothetical protein
LQSRRRDATLGAVTRTSPGSDAMNIDSEVRQFRDQQSLDKARFLARFMYELTLEARNYYGPGGQRNIDPVHLRFINEIQHRITRFLEQILIDDPARPGDEILIRLLLAPRQEKSVELMLHAAWARAVQATG